MDADENVYLDLFKCGLQVQTRETSVKELITDGASLGSISKGEALITTGRHSIEVPSLPIIFLYSSTLWTNVPVLLLKLSKSYLFQTPSLRLSWYHLITMAPYLAFHQDIRTHVSQSRPRMTRRFFRALPKDGQGEGFYVNRARCLPYPAICCFLPTDPPHMRYQTGDQRTWRPGNIGQTLLRFFFFLLGRGSGKGVWKCYSDLVIHHFRGFWNPPIFFDKHISPFVGHRPSSNHRWFGLFRIGQSGSFVL